MHPYIELVQDILQYGERRDDRTGVGTLSIFDAKLSFDLRQRFPLVTLKETRWKIAFLEMLWFIGGHTNVKWLEDRGSKLWTPWGDENGNLGPIYGFNWRRWGAKPDNVPQPKPRLREGVDATFAGVASGVGANGHPLLGTWMGMIQRCYDKNSVGYKNYGARGVHVCDEWLEFINFARDAELIPGWQNKLTEPGMYELDKDIQGDGFCYSRANCSWVTRQENVDARAEWRYTVEKEGRLYSFVNPTQFAREHGFSESNFNHLWHKGGNIVRYGFRFVSKEPLVPEFDQVRALIDGLKNNPTGRRHIVTAWNPAQLRMMALPPCHHTHQCYVTNDGHLDLKLFIRSSDVALGLPFNVAAYALLTHLYARAAGLTARRLIVDIGDAHLYLNHVDAMREAVTMRASVDCQPQLWIKTDNTDIDGYKPDDFEITGYTFHPHIPLPVAV